MNDLIDQNQPQLPDNTRIVRTEEMLLRYNVSLATFNRGMRTGRYLKPFKDGGRENAWLLEDVLEHLQQMKNTEHNKKAQGKLGLLQPQYIPS